MPHTVVVTVLFVCSLALGQTPSAVVSGHVSGPDGIAVPGATIEITARDSGARRVTWSDEQGNYAMASMAPGIYVVKISIAGLSPAEQDVTVADDAHVTADITLVVDLPRAAAAGSAQVPRQDSAQAPRQGSAQASRTPQGGTPSVRFTPQAPAATDVETPPETDANPLPDDNTAGANAFLLSGNIATAEAPGEGGRRNGQGGRGGFQGGGGGGGFAGGRGGGGGFGGRGGGLGGPLAGGGPDASRPQINRIRGAVSEQYGNSALNALPYSLSGPAVVPPSSYVEQASGTLGGPIKIPKIDTGTNRTTFFLNYGLQRSLAPITTFSTVPTALERSGDFSGDSPLYDPATNPSGPRTAFTNNQIPASRVDPAALGLLAYLPLPNLPGTIHNFRLDETLPSSNNRVNGRLVQQLTSRDSLNVSYFFNSAHTDRVSSFPALTSDTTLRGQNLAVGLTQRLTPRVFQSLQLTYNRQHASALGAFANTQDVSGQLGIDGVSTDPRDWGIPLIHFTNFTGLSDALPTDTRNATLRLLDTLTLTRGKHTWRLTAEGRHVELNSTSSPDARGTFTFTGLATSDLGTTGQPLGGTGNDFADFLLGLPQTTSVRFGADTDQLRSWVIAGSVQDDWRATPRLTFNFGVRYEYFQPFTDIDGRLANLLILPGAAGSAVVTGQAPGSLPPSLIRGDPNNVAPRLAMAFRPSADRSLVIRAGYSVLYDGSIYQRLVARLVDEPPFADASTLTTTPDQVLTLEHGFPFIPTDIARNRYAVDPDFRTPMSQTWNVGLEGRLGAQLAVSATYVGTRGSDLDLLLGPNRVLPDQSLELGDAQQFLEERSGASSIYNGLQLELRRQYRNGLSMTATYIWSKSIDDASSVGGAGSTVAQNPNDLAAERGLSTFDVRQRLTMNGSYQLPFGENRRFANQGGLKSELVGGWQISGSATFQTGTPFTALVMGNLTGANGSGAYASQRADATGQPVTLPANQRTIQRFFDTAAFSLPAPGQFGTAGRNTIPGPGSMLVNGAIDRVFMLSSERSGARALRLDVRLAANNLFNTPNFTGLSTVVNAADFGQVIGVSAMRTLALSARFTF